MIPIRGRVRPAGCGRCAPSAPAGAGRMAKCDNPARYGQSSISKETVRAAAFGNGLRTRAEVSLPGDGRPGVGCRRARPTRLQDGRRLDPAPPVARLRLALRSGHLRGGHRPRRPLPRRGPAAQGRRRRLPQDDGAERRAGEEAPADLPRRQVVRLDHLALAHTGVRRRGAPLHQNGFRPAGNQKRSDETLNIDLVAPAGDYYGE